MTIILKGQYIILILGNRVYIKDIDQTWLFESTLVANDAYTLFMTRDLIIQNNSIIFQTITFPLKRIDDGEIFFNVLKNNDLSSFETENEYWTIPESECPSPLPKNHAETIL